MANKILLVSGSSGSGKSTLIETIIVENNMFKLCRSLTTRKKRDTKQDEERYMFTSKKVFKDLLSAGELLEYTVYPDEKDGDFYGTPRSELNRILELEDSIPILELDVYGALQLLNKSEYDIKSCFLIPPPMIVAERLLRRNSESLEVIQKRLQRSIKEVSIACSFYELLLDNTDIEKSKELLLAYGLGHVGPTSRDTRMELVAQYVEEMEQIVKLCAKIQHTMGGSYKGKDILLEISKKQAWKDLHGQTVVEKYANTDREKINIKNIL